MAHHEEAEGAAPAIGAQLYVFEVRSPREIQGAFAAMAHARVGAVLVEASAMMGKERARIADLAAKNRLATIGWWRGMNLTTAKTLGLSIPRSMLIRADDILE